ncbi:MAG: 23S rRNA (adenine(2503)-C(2))-methyltransferase RlmN [Terracidiphilus sp.]
MREDHDQLVSLAPAPEAPAAPRLLFGKDEAALTAVMDEAGEPAFRGRQLADALYRHRLAEIDLITTLPLALRQRLVAEGWQVGRPRISQTFKSTDGTERYLVECPGPERETVEAVWMPEGDGGEAGEDAGAEAAAPESAGAPPHSWERATLCVSSQIGCAVNCRFCLTARMGIRRNLSAGEIAGQVVAALDRHGVEVGRDRVNLVFMGMGEPFLNYDNFMAAVRLLVNEVGLSPRRMTVSTSGIVPGIERFALEPPELRPRLAISLNASNDSTREVIMPVNRKWGIKQILEAVRKVPLRPAERITFEYVLLGGMTDRLVHAEELCRLVRRSGLPVKVNLIAWNPGPGIPYFTPHKDAVEGFRNTLAAAGVRVYVRKPRGRDIFAACGQLKRTVEG